MSDSLVAALERAAPTGEADNLADLLEALEPDLEAVLPAAWPLPRFRLALELELERAPTLHEADAPELVAGGLLAAALGLELGRGAGHVYLVPAGRRLYFELGLAGLLELAGRAPSLRSLEARTVHKGDRFAFQHGTTPRLVHSYAEPPAGREPVAYYAVAQLRAGGARFAVVYPKQVAAAREDSPIGMAPESAWTLAYDSAARKVAAVELVRGLAGLEAAGDALAHDSRLVPLSAELAAALVAEPSNGGDNA